MGDKTCMGVGALTKGLRVGVRPVHPRYKSKYSKLKKLIM